MLLVHIYTRVYICNILYLISSSEHSIPYALQLAGIVEPNDGYCHLYDDEYTYSLRQDYPSISQIASIAKLTSTSIIFAVSNYLEEYEKIAELIPSK